MTLASPKLVSQEHRTECGAACVAMLARVPIEEARVKVHGGASDRSRRTYPKDIRLALASFGLVLGREIWTSNWRNVAKQSQPVLVAMNYRLKSTKSGAKQELWHWAVYDPRSPSAPLLDSQSKVSPRLPGPSKLASYFKVTRREA